MRRSSSTPRVVSRSSAEILGFRMGNAVINSRLTRRKTAPAESSATIVTARPTQHARTTSVLCTSGPRDSRRVASTRWSRPCWRLRASTAASRCRTPRGSVAAAVQRAPHSRRGRVQPRSHGGARGSSGDRSMAAERGRDHCGCRCTPYRTPHTTRFIWRLPTGDAVAQMVGIALQLVLVSHRGLVVSGATST